MEPLGRSPWGFHGKLHEKCAFRPMRNAAEMGKKRKYAAGKEWGLQ